MASEIIARGTHPREKASWQSKMTLSWLNGVLKRGNKRPLQDKDLFPSLSENKMEVLMANIEKKWEKELITSKQQNKDPQLWKVLLKTLSCKKVCWLVFLKLLRFVSATGLPILLWLFLKDLSTDSQRSLTTSLFFVISISLVTFIKGFSMQHCELISEEWGVQLKVSCIALVYKKILYCLSRHDLQKIYTGKTINLVSNDALKMELAGLAMTILCSTPFEVLATGIILWCLIGWQALTGVTLFVVLAFFIGRMSHYSGTLRDKAAAVTDKRLEVMSEIVSGIRAVKMYACEWNFTKVVDALRNVEMSPIRLGGLIVGSLNAFNFTAVPIAGFISVTAMVLAEVHVTAFQIFTVLSSLGIVHFTVTLAMPELIHLITEAHVAAKRIEQFLGDGFVSQLEDASPGITYQQKCERFPQLEFKGTRFSTVAFDNDENVIPLLPCLEKSETRLKDDEFSTVALDKDERVISTSSSFKNNEANVVATPDLFSLVLRNVYCSWTKGERETLRNISLQVQKGQILAITGPVGSGKTSLLMTILRQLPVTRGSLSSNGKIAYVPQIPWVFSGTVRDNIVFGRAFNEGKFQEIVRVCSLQKDLDSFPKKDLSQIGQRGIRLSGGQRQRVSLARALYSEADIYLLDDPLSAVDAKVGRHLFERCICGFLSDRTRVLVTHQLHYLTNLNHIVVLNEGRIAHEGSYRELHEVEHVWKKLMFGQGYWNEDAQKGNMATDLVVPSAVKVVQFESEDAEDLEEEEEERSIGAITWKTYWKYFRVALPIPLICLLVTFIISTKVMFIAPYWWASKIAEMSHDEQKAVSTLVIFGATGVAAWLTALVTAWLFLSTLISASKKLHSKMVLSVIKAPVLFFDTTPMGRILNRFSKDIGSLDKMLPLFFLDGVEVTLAAISSAIIPAVANPWLALFVVPLLAVGVYVARYYLRSSREIKRLEAISCSPVYAHFAETLWGLEIIRSSGMEETFLRKLYEYQDVNTSALHMHMVVSSRRWLSLRTVSLCSALVAATTTGALLVTQSAALAGLSLTFFLGMSEIVLYGIRSISEVENNMTSAERVMHYTELDQEPGYCYDTLPPGGWPQQGNLTVQDLSLSYVKGGPRVLNNISLSIAAKEKIGVAGRTGAGKSSLVAALFRMPDPLGKVLIDDVEVGTLNLQAARKSMAVITQDPVLFRGSLRRNLDPFGTFGDQQLWTVLEKVQMKNLVGTLPGQLDYQLKESGSNFSAGERQLLCLARALVQGGKIIIMDEATANVDFKTDHLIQQVIRSKFEDCTVLTIAHRLNTIIDYDKVLVLDGGRVVEFDKPEILLTKKNGLFAELVRYQSQASQGIDAIGEEKDLVDTS